MLLEFKIMEDTIKDLGDSFGSNFILNLQITDHAMKIYKGKIENDMSFIMLLEDDNENKISGLTMTNWRANILQAQASKILNKVRFDFMPLYSYVGSNEWVDGILTETFNHEKGCEEYIIKKDGCFEHHLSLEEFNILNTLNKLKRQYTDILYRSVCKGKLHLKDVSMEEKLRNRKIKPVHSEPTKENIDKVKKAIDKILSTNSTCDYPTEEGCGRTVFLIDGFAVKFPEDCENIICTGGAQNLKEAEVYFKSQHESLVPVYAVYKGCLICKEVIDSHYVEEITGLHYTEIDELIAKEIDKMKDLIEEFNLDIQDIKSARNWGFDTEDYTFKCVDYGLENR